MGNAIRYTLLALVAASLLVAGAVWAVADNPAGPLTHHCHEDEMQAVTPDGLACVPLDAVMPRQVRDGLAEQATTVHDSYEFDRR